MGQKKRLSALLRSDAQTAKEITEMYPADWDMDAIFRKSYRKFRQQACVTENGRNPADLHAEGLPRRNVITHANRWLTAACLMLTIGIAGGVAWMQFSVTEPQRTLPTDTAATTAPVEELLPVYTVSSDATQQTDAPAQTDPEPLPVSGTAATTQETGSSPSESRPVQPSVPDTPQPPADVPQITGTHTTSPTQQTAPQMTETVPLPPENGEPSFDPTPPNDDDPPPSSAAPPANDPWTLLDDPSVSETEFSIFYTFEDTTQYPSPEFSVDLEDYSVTITRPNEYSISNMISNEKTGVKAYALFNSGFRAQLLFRHSVYSYSKVYVQTQNGLSSGYLLTGSTNNRLIWFDGRYLCELWSSNATTAELFCIAEAMTTH